MKNLTKLINIKSLSSILFLSLSLMASMVNGQDSTTTRLTSETTTVEPWMWIVGAVAMIFLIVALVRGVVAESAQE